MNRMETTRVPSRWERIFEQSFARNLHLAFAALIYTPFIFFGYGEQPDSYLVVTTGRRLLSTGNYLPSRRPGSLVYEVSQALLDRIGGSVASNLGTLLISLVFLTAFTGILRRLKVPLREYLVWIMLLLPVYWNNSTVTMDYVWAMAFSTAGFYYAIQRRYVPAAMLWALSVGTRLNTVVTLAGFFIYLWLEFPEDRKKLLIASAASGLLAALFFIPSFASMNYTFEFMNVSVNVGEPSLWTPYLRVGRFVYKNIYLWGLAGSLIILGALLFYARDFRALASRQWRSLTAACLIAIVGGEAFFFKYPIKVEYLLPIVPFVLILLGIALEKRKKTIFALIVFVALYNFVSVNIAQPDLRWRARDASYSVIIERGPLMQNFRERMAYRSCEEITCVAAANDELLRRIRQREKENILF
jgi:hypothetical protein